MHVQANRTPSELKESMQEHLRLHFDTQDASDEQVHACQTLVPSQYFASIAESSVPCSASSYVC